MNDENEDEIVLVVDDSPDTVSMLNDALDNEGFSVLVALSGMQAVSICKKIKPDLYIEKNHASSFVGTDLNYRLRNLGVDTVCIAGYMTQNCCDATARDASQLGFNVEFFSDATGTLEFKNNAGVVSAEELHRSFLVAQAFGFSRVLTLNEWISLL